MNVAGRGLLFVPVTYPERFAEAEAIARRVLALAQPGARREVGHDL